MSEFEIAGVALLVIPVAGFMIFFVGELVHSHRQREYLRSFCELQRRRQELRDLIR